jgi:hypothetical protein
LWKVVINKNRPRKQEVRAYARIRVEFRPPLFSGGAAKIASELRKRVRNVSYTNVYRAFAKWTDDGSLQQAFIASVAHLSAEKKLDLRVLHGDGTNTVAKKGAMGLATPATSTRRGRRSSPSPTTMAMSSHLYQWHQ